MSDRISPEEAARHVLWVNGDRQHGYQPGSFTTSLLATWARADWENRARLEQAFPEYVEAIDISNQFGSSALVDWLEARESRS